MQWLGKHETSFMNIKNLNDHKLMISTVLWWNCMILVNRLLTGHMGLTFLTFNCFGTLTAWASSNWPVALRNAHRGLLWLVQIKPPYSNPERVLSAADSLRNSPWFLIEYFQSKKGLMTCYKTSGYLAKRFITHTHTHTLKGIKTSL